MAFDPDQFIAENSPKPVESSGFDPDAFIKESAPTDPKGKLELAKVRWESYKARRQAEGKPVVIGEDLSPEALEYQDAIKNYTKASGIGERIKDEWEDADLKKAGAGLLDMVKSVWNLNPFNMAASAYEAGNKEIVEKELEMDRAKKAQHPYLRMSGDWRPEELSAEEKAKSYGKALAGKATGQIAGAIEGGGEALSGAAGVVSKLAEEGVRAAGGEDVAASMALGRDIVQSQLKSGYNTIAEAVRADEEARAGGKVIGGAAIPITIPGFSRAMSTATDLTKAGARKLTGLTESAVGGGASITGDTLRVLGTPKKVVSDIKTKVLGAKPLIKPESFLGAGKVVGAFDEALNDFITSDKIRLGEEIRALGRATSAAKVTDAGFLDDVIAGAKIAKSDLQKSLDEAVDRLSKIDKEANPGKFDFAESTVSNIQRKIDSIEKVEGRLSKVRNSNVGNIIDFTENALAPAAVGASLGLAYGAGSEDANAFEAAVPGAFYGVMFNILGKAMTAKPSKDGEGTIALQEPKPSGPDTIVKRPDVIDLEIVDDPFVVGKNIRELVSTADAAYSKTQALEAGSETPALAGAAAPAALPGPKAQPLLETSPAPKQLPAPAPEAAKANAEVTPEAKAVEALPALAERKPLAGGLKGFRAKEIQDLFIDGGYKNTKLSDRGIFEKLRSYSNEELQTIIDNGGPEIAEAAKNVMEFKAKKAIDDESPTKPLSGKSVQETSGETLVLKGQTPEELGRAKKIENLKKFVDEEFFDLNYKDQQDWIKSLSDEEISAVKKHIKDNEDLADLDYELNKEEKSRTAPAEAPSEVATETPVQAKPAPRRQKVYIKAPEAGGTGRGVKIGEDIYKLGKIVSEGPDGVIYEARPKTSGKIAVLQHEKGFQMVEKPSWKKTRSKSSDLGLNESAMERRWGSEWKEMLERGEIDAQDPYGTLSKKPLQGK